MKSEPNTGKIRKVTLKVCPIYDILSDLLQSNRVEHTHARTLVHDTINGIYSQTPDRSRVLSKYDFLCWKTLVNTEGAIQFGKSRETGY